ncbi:MAG TPA: enoyl-CoA hydratase-related protein [Acidimicrobiia bacterium]|jgi:enoyl-CoA hydratase/carnithine racemase|nr:enoyl-CoA hydratase-related protein [Acidimicrobiia bacterium]
MFRYEVRGPAAWLIIDDPERRNPLSLPVMEELRDALGTAAADRMVRVVVVTGAGDRAFSAGGDLAGGFFDKPLELHHQRGALADVFRLMRRLGKPTIARVNGHALAGGFGLAAACDIVVAVEQARFGTPEIDVGLWPMMIGAVLVRCMPRRAVLELMLTGRLIDAVEAKALGAVSRVVPPDRLDDEVDALVAQLAAKSPVILRLGRDAFYAVDDLGFDEALDHLQAGLTSVASTDDGAEGVRAFLEKRSPEWMGR